MTIITFIIHAIFLFFVRETSFLKTHPIKLEHSVTF